MLWRAASVCPGEKKKKRGGREGREKGGRGGLYTERTSGRGCTVRSGRCSVSGPLSVLSAATPGENTQGRLYHTAQPNLLRDECSRPSQSPLSKWLMDVAGRGGRPMGGGKGGGAPASGVGLRRSTAAVQQRYSRRRVVYADGVGGCLGLWGERWGSPHSGG